jgi:anti-sigma factor RsiW
MQCRQVLARMSAYVDHELDAASTMNFDFHLEECVDCRQVLGDFRRVDDALRELQRLKLGPEFSKRAVALAGTPDVRTHPKGLPELSALAFLAEVFGDVQGLLGITARPHPGNLELDEFNDFPPLSMGSLYFEILGEHGRNQY